MKGTLRGHLLRPGSPIVTTVWRTLMLAAIPRLGKGGEAARGRHGSRALKRALGATALGRVTSEERAWVERIEHRRRELTSELAVARAWIPSNSDTEGSEAMAVPIRYAAAMVSLPKVWCMFLMRLVRELAPRSCLELGTGFGISGAYQAAALELNGAGQLITLEAATDFAQVAERGFSSLGLERRAGVRVGPIGETLDGVLANAAPIDCAFLDADHTEHATLESFHAILPHLSDGAVVVFDDIRWTGVKRAWAAITNDPLVRTAAGVWRVGAAVI
jgi:predicted O-methyltransferase YrrM